MTEGRGFIKMVEGHGFNINDIYRFESDGTNYYVYEGLCDNRKTKWITKTVWDYKIKFV